MIPDGFVPGGAAAPTASQVASAQAPDAEGVNYAALTFDDGPNPPDTNELLDFLLANDVKATFCVIGDNIQSAAQIATLNRIVDEGHQLCNHTTGWDSVDSWTDQEIADDLIENLQIIRDAVGDPNLKVPFYRAPNGAWGNSGAVAAELGMQPLGLGNLINDWETQDEALLTQRLEEILVPANSGEIVLVHDGGGDRSGSVAAVKTVVADRLANGWTFTFPEGTPSAAGTVAFSTDFENGGLDGWELRDSGWSEEDEGAPLPGTPSVELTEAQSFSPTHSAVVQDRNSQGDGIRYEVTDALDAGTQYEVTASFRFADGEEPGDIWMSLQNGPSTFNTLGQFSGMSNSEWVTITGSFTMPAVAEGNQAWIYFETAYDGGAKGNTSTFYVDDISAVVPEPPVIQELTPIKDTVPFPMGVAIDSRETVGAPADLLLRHFNQISAENFMKPEAWYDGDGNFAPNAGEIDSLMDFAVENDLRMYGHVLVWHSQTPAFFFQDESGAPLTNSPEDQAILRSRMETHINNVAEYLSQWGEYGGDNPLVAWDVVNEVIDDSAAYSDGMRRSEWYRILGETFVDDAFEFAEAAFNGTYAADGVDRPVTLFINDYNTEQAGKRGRYLGLIERLINRGAPIDGIGHQFHLNLSLPVENLEQAIVDAKALGLIQAVTEFDVTTGVPESEAKFIDQGYYYRDAFEIFRTYADDIYSATVWGLIDSRSWRDDNGGPLVFDDAFQAKPAYYGIVNGEGGSEPLPPRLRTANVFAGSVEIDADATDSEVWDRLPLLDIEGHGDFQFRWAPDHMTVHVTVEDATEESADGLEFTVGATDYTFGRDGSGDVTGTVSETASGYDAVVHLPLSGAAEGDTVEFDARVVDGGDTYGWNTPGVTGTLTLVEELSYTEIPETADAPAIDGTKESLWDDADVITTDKEVTGSGGAIGTFHSLWKDNTLYLYAEIADDVVDVTGSDPWTQDSVEIYVDGGNFKNGAYRYDDTQIRINAENVVSFGTGDEGFQANRVESATSLIDGGWAVEVAISLLEYGGEGTFHGLDVQVNDATAGARDTIRNWADPTGAGYQSTARWGVAQLVAADVTDPGDGGGNPGGGNNGGGNNGGGNNGGGNNGGGNPGGGPGNGNGGPPFLSEDGVLELPNGNIVVPGSARRGETIDVNVGRQLAGTQTQAVLYSEPTLIGTDVVSANGGIRVTIPMDTELRTHTLAIYDAQGNVLGWATIEILAADGSLAATGADGFLAPALLAMLLMLAGSALALRQRREQVKGA
ncbi:endo-1,4-beta-xylanase [Demequina activiva]|uniref:endo-1,4-beta-xylanase n=1 Tax=Demequina activiva TaxID=1582364 RepID=UPI001942BDC2|nr:endo-1,4-beta-xylanase [Demequina activiva]